MTSTSQCEKNCARDALKETERGWKSAWRDARESGTRSAHAGRGNMLSEHEVATVDSLLLGDSCQEEPETVTATWRVLELLRRCDHHPQLSQICKDDVVMEKLLMTLATDARGETVARFCGYVGAELAVRDPTPLVSYLGPPANADYLASLCAEHIHLPEVGNMIEACCMDSLATNEAVKRFLLSLHDTIIHLTIAQEDFRLEHLQLLCRLTAEKQLSSLHSAFPDVTERIIMMVKRTEHMPLLVLSEVASVCLRQKLKEIEIIVFERAEKLISLGRFEAKRIREHDAVEIKCMRRLIHLLKNRVGDSKPLRKLPRATADAQPTMPAMLMQLSELTLDSTKFIDAKPTSDRGVMACEAAEVLLSSVGYLWSREEVTQCATFSERDWDKCVRMLEERRRIDPNPDESKRALAILRLAEALRPLPLSEHSTRPPAAEQQRGVDAIDAATSPHQSLEPPPRIAARASNEASDAATATCTSAAMVRAPVQAEAPVAKVSPQQDQQASEVKQWWTRWIPDWARNAVG